MSLTNEYILPNKVSAKEKKIMGGGGLASILLSGFNPLIGIAGLAITRVAGIYSKIKNKKINDEIFYDSLENFNNGYIKLDLSRFGKLKTYLPKKYDRKIQNIISTAKLNSKHDVVLTVNENGEFKIQYKDANCLTRNYTPITIEFELTKEIYSANNKSKQNNNNNAINNQEINALKNMRGKEKIKKKTPITKLYV